MKKLLFGTIGFAALIVTPALAADMALKAPPPPPVDIWAGWYVGVNIGGSWGRAHDTTTYGAPPVPFTSTSSHLDGVIGGGQVGYNWHSSNWLFGVEADIQGSGERGTATTSLFIPGVGCTFAPCGTAATLVDQEKLPWFGTLRARVGVLAAPTWLFYVTGGLAYGEIKSSEIGTGTTIITTTIVNNFNTTRAGWTVGGGIEGVISGNWTGKLEYLYMDFGTINYTYAGLGVFNPVFLSTRVTDNVVRVGLNYHFH
ncbi:MAG TPA: outer membrane protein [Xanthobacteraceae bacterium]|nr:outer membrane protein [Xanthobacteraceae bacterium]